jgi:SAM-dependent methyltransferase
MTAQSHGWGAIAPWVARWAHLVPSNGHVLDVASGAGRHSLYFATQGHPVTAVDRDADALISLQARHAALPKPAGRLKTLCADIENAPWPLSETFDAIVMTNYLWRPLWPALRSALAPGGVLVMETFALGQETIGKPSRPAFLLAPGEALQLAGDLRVVAYEDGFEPPSEASPTGRYVQRLTATSPGTPSSPLGRM